MKLAAQPASITIGSNAPGAVTVCRLGYGTMRLTGPGIWGEPPNRGEALQILRAAVDAGINLLDTADYYGEDVTNRLIAEALYPYPEELVICSKVGATRLPDKSWVAHCRPEQLRQSIDNNLRTLRLEQLALVHLRRMPDADVPFEESLDAMIALQQEGRIRHLGLSNVSREELEMGLKKAPIASVENLYGYAQRSNMALPLPGDRGGEAVLDLCAANGIPMLPYYSLVTSLPKEQEALNSIAKKYGITAAQVNIAWLLHRSPWMLPIPGTSSLAHLRENIAAAAVALSAEDMELLG
jgi:pyridoxine 4-dehydrogenase